MIKFKFMFFLVVFSCFTIVSCIKEDEQIKQSVVVDFSSRKNDNGSKKSADSVRRLRVAVGAIISSKETLKYYKELLNYISKKLNYNIEFKQKKTYGEINEFIANGKVDLAFICSGAYIEGKKNNECEILAVPICQGKPFYQAYVIVHKSSGIDDFIQLKDKTFAYTDPMSNTGKLYADKRLVELGYASEDFFEKTIYSHAHDMSIQLVSKQVVSGATIDGLIFDYLSKFNPDKIKNLKVIEKSENYGIPPIVVPIDLDQNLKSLLKEIFLSIHKETIGQEILDKLLIERFIEGSDENYNSIRMAKRIVSK